jgi:hypothetical protein
MDIKDCLKGNVTFQYFRKNELFYKTENGFTFRVPAEDTGDGEFLATDRAMMFMRYIRKEIDAQKET